MFMRKIIKNYKKASRILSPIAFALLLSACETASIQRQPLYDITSPASESSMFYLLKAQSDEKDDKITWYLLALKALIKEKQYYKADEVLARLSKMPMTQLQLSEWQISRAMLQAEKGNLRQAITQLNFQSSWRLPPEQYKRYYLLKKRIYQELNNQPGAVLSAIQAAPYIANPAERTQNNDFINKSLNELQPLALDMLSKAGNETLTQWIDLIKQTRQYAYNPVQKQNVINQWLSEHASHPAAIYYTADAATSEPVSFTQPSKVAVLLPLTGKFSAQGEAIRNGLIQASTDDHSSSKASLAFFDTNALSMREIIRQLSQSNIQLVIGPLQKNKVNEFLTLNRQQLPTLAMNVLSNQEGTPPNMCFFTLSPEQEAMQAAHHLAEKEFEFPLVIAPNSKFGQRVSQAFSEAWLRNKGEQAEIAYFKNAAGMQKTVQQAFGLIDSQTRAVEINQLLEQQMKSEQRSRRDIDAVYLIANSDELTLLKPFIEVTINPDAIPPKLFASSRGNSRVKGMGEIGELNGIEFTDIPLIVNRSSATSETVNELWPDLNNSMTRLHALGLDAYALIEQLPKMQKILSINIKDIQDYSHLGLAVTFSDNYLG